MSDATFHTTMQDLRRAESKLSLCHSGKTPADSHVSRMKSIIDKNTDIGAQIEKVKANLPLPDQPPVASDWNPLDQRITGVGSGRLEFPPDNTGLRGSLAPGKSADELELEL